MLEQFLIVSTEQMSAGAYLICTAASLILGLFIALVHMYHNEYSKHFVTTLVVLPAVVQSVIMLVNGNVGTGVAVMGAFSLVRFRSLPGNSREIASIFLAMAVGLATGMRYIGIALLLVVCIGAAMVLLVTMRFGEKKLVGKELKVTIPENLDYEGIFDDLFAEFTGSHRLVKVKTVNMGSLYELHYHIAMKQDKSEKAFLDAIRCRNGNLTVSCGYASTNREEL
ncbi:MAG: DUF4956 domain-containing protein [Lachnospiraceae bacterium]|nr:DUF4956 domain-containing protein [Lachnospiraceae bacterium]